MHGGVLIADKYLPLKTVNISSELKAKEKKLSSLQWKYLQNQSQH